MIFTSAVFLIMFLPVCIIANYFMAERYRNTFLCIMSFIFYFWCGLSFLVLIFISATLVFLFGLMIDGAKGRKRKAWLLIGIVLHLGVLFYYKYAFGILGAGLQWLADVTGQNYSIPIHTPILPLGISFYTFSALSYLLDIYWGKCHAQSKILNVYLYVLFFPKVVQGPIMRYLDFKDQLSGRAVDLEGLNIGFELFIKGMVKKVMIADQLQALVTYSFENIGKVGTIPAWIGAVAYLLQLYYDFSGYSDMAIGIGHMLGFRLPKNFDHPYIAAGAAEYWRRWHSTLGQWFKDYVYMPCFRSVQGMKWIQKFKHPMMICDIAALLVVWCLTGIWHGSGLKFLLWGFWWFVFIAFERLRDNHRKKARRRKNCLLIKNTVLQNVCDRIIAVFAFVFGQVLFRADSIRVALAYFKRMLIWDHRDGILFLHQFNNYTVFILIIGLLFCFPIYDKIKQLIFENSSMLLGLYRLALLAVFFVAFAYMISAGYASFLYEVF